MRVRVLSAVARARIAAAFVVVATLASPRAQSGDRADLDAVARIQEEGMKHSQVMDTLSYLTDVYGSRLTNSPQMHAAADWTIERLRSWQLANVRKEAWGPFGRGWSNEKFTANVVAPTPWPLLAFPKAWTNGTNGTVIGEAVLAVIDREEDFPQWAGKLKGKFVLPVAARGVKPFFDAPGHRLTDGELTLMEQQQPLPAAQPPAASSPGAVVYNLAKKRMEFFSREGVAAVLEPGNGTGDHGSVQVMGSDENRRSDAYATATQVVVSTEHYGRIVRTLERHVPVRIELNAQNRFYDQPLDVFNIVAEIPGTDKADEVVMLGGHFDSWQAGTGATDNAAGSAATMEALRILKATGLPMRRTVRLALWTGEEEGLLGSAAYVKEHFANRGTMELKPEHAKVSAYFNLDNGTGLIRGVYLQNNEAVRPVFKAWMEPFQAIGMKTMTIRGTGGTDHLSFDAVGLPGFQFIQDPIEYFTHSHHSSMDLYERVQSDDLMKDAVIIASFVYHAANRDDLLPRKPLPAPRTPPQPASATR